MTRPPSSNSSRYVHRELHPDRAAVHGEDAGDHSLQATALVNEAYLRLMDLRPVKLAESDAFPRHVGSPDASDYVDWRDRRGSKQVHAPRE